MRRLLPAGIAVVLALAVAAPAAGGAPPAKPQASYNAWVNYQSDTDLAGPGVHTKMWVRYSQYGDSQVIQISGFGWDSGPTGGNMLSDWAWAYERVYPAQPAVGSVAPSLSDAWASSDTLELQCWTPGKCPQLPARIVASARWTAIGPMSAEQARDTMGDPTLIVIRRSRPAVVILDLSYPDNDGPLPVPALVTSDSISWDHFTPVRS
jgi:hypothetical protein